MKNWYDILKGTIESYHPWKNEQILRCGSGNMPDFVKLTEWSKKKFFSTFFEKKFFLDHSVSFTKSAIFFEPYLRIGSFFQEW